MLVAEAVNVWRRETRAEVRAACYLVSALANNLPDIDIVYTWITGPKPLGSLLHHRGHTHTLPIALGLAWLLGVVALRLLRKRHASWGQAESRVLLGLALAGPLVHLTMDFGNNYGVHPFWPLSGRWFYGDTIFIVEPSWWALGIPLIAARLQRRWLSGLLWVLLVALLVVCWFVPFVLTGSRLALLAMTGASFWLSRQASPRVAISATLAGWAAVAGVFALGSGRAKASILSATEAAFPALQVHDVALTPMPANPLCWEALLAGEQGDEYRVVRASVALPPLARESCTAGLDVSPTAHVSRVTRVDRGGVRFLTEYAAPRGEIAALYASNCWFRAATQFFRLPYVSQVAASPHEPGGMYAGDLRYDRSPGADFSDLRLPAGNEPCPRFVPGWREPRADLLRR